RRRQRENPFFPLSSLGAGGGADRDRTGDPLLAKQVLSQLSYSPLSCLAIRMAALRRHAVGASPAERHSAREPAIATRRLPLESPAEAKPDSRWWAWEDLNFRPHPYQGCALTN